jgi:hypothetical protein
MGGLDHALAVSARIAALAAGWIYERVHFVLKTEP